MYLLVIDSLCSRDLLVDSKWTYLKCSINFYLAWCSRFIYFDISTQEWIVICCSLVIYLLTVSQRVCVFFSFLRFFIRFLKMITAHASSVKKNNSVLKTQKIIICCCYCKFCLFCCLHLTFVYFLCVVIFVFREISWKFDIELISWLWIVENKIILLHFYLI